MNRDEMFRYQENATSPEGEDSRSEEEKRQEEERREQVQEVLGLPGYGLLHRLMIGKVEEAQTKLDRLDTPSEHLRYWQGVVAGVVEVQRKFVEMGRSEDERRRSYE